MKDRFASLYFKKFAGHLVILLVLCSSNEPLQCYATEDLDESSALLSSIEQNPETPPHTTNSEDDMFNTPQGEEHKINRTEDRMKEVAEVYVKIMDFQQGDLLYGLDGSRQYIREILKKRNLGAVTIDAYNKVFLSLDFSKIKNWEDLDEELESHVFDPNSGLVEDNYYWAREYAKVLFKGGVFKWIDDQYFPEHRKFKKISCKHALIFSKKSGSKIHFILDQLDPGPVVLKGQDPFSDKNFKESYTASELRYLYRMWMNDSHSIEHVYFYKEGKKLEDPPWLIRPAFWKKYKARFGRTKEECEILSDCSELECEENTQVNGNKRKFPEFFT